MAFRFLCVLLIFENAPSTGFKPVECEGSLGCSGARLIDKRLSERLRGDNRLCLPLPPVLSRRAAMKKTTGTDRSITSGWRPATQAVRGGTWRSEHGETSEALFLTSGYSYDDAQTVADRFAGEAQGGTSPRARAAPTASRAST